MTSNSVAPAVSVLASASPLQRVRNQSHRMSAAQAFRGSVRETLRGRSNSIDLLLLANGSAFDPNSRPIELWHQLLLCCLLYEVIIIPYLVTFSTKSEQWLTPFVMVVYSCELIFVADIYVELNMGFYEDGDVNLDRKKSRAKYVKSPRFVLDILALLPLSLMPLTKAYSPIVFEMHKLIRCWRIPKYIARLDDVYAKYFVVLKMFKVLVVIVLLSHFVACVRFSFGYDEYGDNEWLPEHTEHGQSTNTKYLISLFWAFGLLTGLFEGDLPHSILEFLFTIFVALCGFSLFTYVCATFFMISQCESGYTASSEARINQFKHLLSFHKVPETLQDQALDYLKRYYTYTESNDREAMRLLCPSIAKDVQVAMLKDMVANIIFFRDCNEQFIIAITTLLELISLPANFIMFRESDIGDAMYIVNSGVLHVIVRGVKVREVRKGSFFGEMALFLNRPRYASVMTTTYCTLYKLVRFDMERVLEGYPEYSTTIPKKVEEMAKRLFHRSSRVSIMTPGLGSSYEPPELENEITTTKKKFGGLIRKHIKLTRTNTASPNLLAITAAAVKAAPKVTPLEVPEKTKNAPSTGPEADLKDIRSPPIPAAKSSVSKRNSSALHIAHSMHEFYGHMARTQKAAKSAWWTIFLLKTAIERESKRRMWWIMILEIVLLYNWAIIPLQLSFQLMDHPSGFITALNVLSDIVLWGDIYLNFNLSYTVDSEKIWSTERSARNYVKSWFLLDVLFALPLSMNASNLERTAVRIPRLFRMLRLQGHFKEVDDFFQLKSRQRLLLFGVLLIMLYHVIACLHFSITYIEGFSSKPDAWIPSDDIYLRLLNSSYYIDVNNVTYPVNSKEVEKIANMQFFRSLYYAANVLTALGRTIEPDSNIQYRAALMFMLSGFFITAIVVDNVQKRFTASAFEQKEFFAVRSRIQIFLRRQKAPLVIHQRVNAFLDFWWSSHRGAVISELLEELPETIKYEIMQSICKPALQSLALLVGVRPVLIDLEQVFLNNVKFILYGQGETVYRQGDYASGLFFLLEGEVCLITNGGAPRSIPQGGFFGTAALKIDDNSVSYSERVTTISGCIFLFVSRVQLQAMYRTFPAFPEAIVALEKRFLDPKLAKASELATSNRVQVKSRHPIIQRVFGRFFSHEETVFDPDSPYILVWETWVFIMMTIQWAVVTFHICFGVPVERRTTADVMTALLESQFVIDMFVRSRLGFYEFGDKVMDVRRIKRKYIRSREFAIDILALLPLFMINWLPSNQRLEMLNLNKLFRIIKVPNQLMALENKYLKITLELRLFKLVYYTFLLSHTFGCVWFDFASHASGIGGEEGVSFGEEAWLPPASLENATVTLQYFASLFWSFGLMSASNPGELPKTVSQCMFSVITMTCGFFLFAYVVGNFTDIIELMDAENREFYAKMGFLRHLLEHFNLPVPIQDKFKAYFFFKRFHSITQEYLLERCLPPSLLADIRMVHLQPMIVKVSFLADMEASVTRMLVSQFSQVMVVKDQFVYKFGEEGGDMYFVFAGTLDTLLPRDEFLRDSSVVETKSINIKQDPTNGQNWHVMAAPVDLNKLTKLAEICSGSYFGENALFFNSVRSAYVRATSSCILYRLSRHSLELVFDRYPDWKAKVLRVMQVQQELYRLNRIAFEELQNAATGKMMAQVDHLNARAERTEEELLNFRRARANITKRKASQSTRVLHSQGASMAAEQTSEGILQTPKALVILFQGASAQSWHHLTWLKCVTCTTIFVAIIVPYKISFDSLERTTSWLPEIIGQIELLCEFIFLADIWVNWRIKGSPESMDLYEQDHRESYKKERLLWDILAAFPVDYLLSTLKTSPWYRINRCIKLRNFYHYMSEINRTSIHNEMHRLGTTAILYVLMIYWSACSYFALAEHGHYGEEWDAWLPASCLELPENEDPSTKLITLRLLRGLFFATTTFVKKGRTFIPASTTQYVFAIISCFVGLLVMAFMIGEVAGLFISYIGNEVIYRKNHIAVELYMGRWKISGPLRSRIQSFLTSLWSSHHGVDYQSLLEEVPSSIRTESILNIANWPLRAFVDDIFRPIYRAEHVGNIDSLKQAIAQKLRFEGYPRGENVLVEGSITKAMYFVVKGRLFANSRTHPLTYRNLNFNKGDYFGEKGLLGFSVGFYSVRTLLACDLLSLSAESLLEVLRSHLVYSLAIGFATHAAQELKKLPPAATGKMVEIRWGTQLLSAIANDRQEAFVLLELGNEAEKIRAHQTLTIIETRFNLRTPEEAFSAFRPLIQLVIPNGVFLNYGTASVGSVRMPSVGDSSFGGKHRSESKTDSTKTKSPLASVLHALESTRKRVESHVQETEPIDETKNVKTASAPNESADRFHSVPILAMSSSTALFRRRSSAASEASVSAALAGSDLQVSDLMSRTASLNDRRNSYDGPTANQIII